MNSSPDNHSNSKAATPPRISLRGISKSYGGAPALSDVGFDLLPGEIHALLGENGAGKTTLMNILFGLTRPGAGEIHIEGRPAVLASPKDAMARGIGMVHQHFMLVPNLTVAENLFLGMELPGAGGPWTSPKGYCAAARLAAERFRIQIDAGARVEDLSVGEEQRVELLKALCRGARVLILDEPTAVLTPSEIDELFSIMEGLRADGRSIIFISHKLNEVARICDRVTVLRRGRVAATVQASEADPDRLAELMVGRALADGPARTPFQGESHPVLRLDNVSSDKGRGLAGVSLEARAGEIFAVTGVEGNGQTELAAMLAGALEPSSGQVWFHRRDISRLSPAGRVELGLAVIAGDRQREGLALDLSIEENLILKSYSRPPFSRWGMISAKAVKEFAGRTMQRHDIRAPSASARAGSLSGGNQQKVVVGREIALMDKALVAVNPTRGLDVGAAKAVHGELLRARENGAAIVLITTELDEAMTLADRIAVMFKGRCHDAGAPPFDRKAIGRLMLGGGGDGD